MTELSNALYPKEYGIRGRGAGSPDFKRCCSSVHETWNYRQCTKPRGYGPDKAYCKIHDPAAIAARKKAADEKYRIERNKQRYGFYGKFFYDALKSIADGDSAPVELARKAIEEFHKGEMK